MDNNNSWCFSSVTISHKKSVGGLGRRPFRYSWNGTKNPLSVLCGSFDRHRIFLLNFVRPQKKRKTNAVFAFGIPRTMAIEKDCRIDAMCPVLLRAHNIEGISVSVSMLHLLARANAFGQSDIAERDEMSASDEMEFPLLCSLPKAKRSAPNGCWPLLLRAVFSTCRSCVFSSCIVIAYMQPVDTFDGSRQWISNIFRREEHIRIGRSSRRRIITYTAIWYSITNA